MKVSEKKALEIHLDHDDIIDAIFEYILETNPEIADDWNTDEMEVELRVARNKPDGGGVELRGIVKSAVSLMKDTKTPDEPMIPENEKVKEGDISLGDINWDTGQHP